MKILFISDLYPIKIDERHTPLTLHNFVIEWIKQGHKVDVIKPNFIFNSFLRKKPFYTDGFYQFEGVKIFNVNYFTPFLFNVAEKLETIKKSYASAHPRIHAFESSFLFSDYDIIIAHMPSGIIFANKLTKIIKKPLVCGVHASDIEILINPIYKFYFRSQLKDAYKNAKKIACRSHVLQKKFNKLMPELAEKTFVASSGVKVEEVKRRRSEEVWENNNASTHPRIYSSIITCANLIKRKNIDKLILAMKDLDGFKLKIIGDGKELKNLKKLTRKVIPSIHRNKIDFLGRLSHEKVLEEMRKSDIFILPSIKETFGIVYPEAMASGCITVCTKDDGIDGIIIDSENGFLCEPTPEGIKETLLQIKNSCAHNTPHNIEKIIENSLRTVKRLTPEDCAKEYLRLII